MIAVWIEPHERHEAIEAYRDRLTESQIEQIEEAPETALIQLQMGLCGDPAVNAVHIIEEG